jgi:hypothetical protein
MAVTDEQQIAVDLRRVDIVSRRTTAAAET